MLFNCPWARQFTPYFVKYLHPVGFSFFALFFSYPLLLQLWDLQDVVLFLWAGWGGADRDVDGEGERLICLLSFLFV